MEILITPNHEKEFVELEEAFRKNKRLYHCEKCGFILLNASVDYHTLLIVGKCSNPACRRVTRYVLYMGKIRLLNNRILSKLSSERQTQLRAFLNSDII
ncbi:hypothetical protein COX05_04160 [candidate division WWE3 bacterium CG22_combo_CG10-13_8_21_14_all_39_12]|uniref:Uncharacterized protein n=1 Tax=candidate division WWE3 bacterium CG22_combo_CG10-13_8_21_14_all_39_12 TaxID=1975094 RepID=A0A2H0BEX8_UNCKA|nr:MAG: hypothetical protein COX05_04160 [candidate division WWE3 bacterium CG22_combo_CG10-13_8_21_14_all_39_12]